MQSTFLAWVFRMPLIKRWSLMFCHKKENIAEHSHQVAVVAHLLTLIYNKKVAVLNNQMSLNPDRAATIALYHDQVEIYTGDTVTPIKYHNHELTREFKKLEVTAENLCLETLPEEFKDDFAGLLLSEQIEPEYARIVKSADVICAYIKTLDELKHHNYEFEHVKLNLEKKLVKLKEQVEVSYFVDVFMASCVTSLDKLTDD
ncbi:MAG: 5'-deoxynucleotidase [gamma proteobacterium symbiont of Bathyaustriella thionipta]|nr:5'-deoxynucleotidase [gamma proteobacterium symbiont of Bathyaustriella thionipta]MCU7951455.1 5'-deoxynucleotidase [gamma proteobacterium symbiont of Bathyaustriella thionipta]MCU7953539.1 5'-deoxynucleotidase [gamma proteobacterium symbiont of Bathyaustriella thionipta]MCU7957989.1 5'-deoxynucleotidase [gamma proteobacterium symbiont of Bathyaustriella thionipta]MCU7967230.1 5'-deoxynucleotidase [gamma proteobacterium symbiont of Bathyaustriella thionipta]